MFSDIVYKSEITFVFIIMLSEIDVVSETKGIYYIYEKGEVIAKVVVENDGLLKKVSYNGAEKN